MVATMANIEQRHMADGKAHDDPLNLGAEPHLRIAFAPVSE